MDEKRMKLECYFYLAKKRGIFTNKEFLDICGVSSLEGLKYLTDFRVTELLFEIEFLLGINTHEKILENEISIKQMTLF